MIDYAPCIPMETFAYFHSQNSPGAWLQDQKQYLLTMITSLEGLPNLLVEGRTWQSSCAFLFIQTWCLFRDCVLLIFSICFRLALNFLRRPYLSLRIFTEGNDGATSEGINYLLTAEDFQPNWMKTKGQETRPCFRVTECSSVNFWALLSFC